MKLDFILNKDIKDNENKRGWERLNFTDCRHQMGFLQLWVLEL
jgi:hypothetical protein